jgi:REP element-mobilizing transposase RayT
MEPRKTRKSWNVPGQAHMLTFSTNGCRPYLALPGAPKAFLDNLDRARHLLEFEVWAYVVMLDHAHVLLRPLSEAYDMAKILRAIKEQSARDILALFPHIRSEVAVSRKSGVTQAKFWLPGGGYDRNVASARDARIAVTYIHSNPIKAGFCLGQTDWPWSSAAANLPIPVDPMNFWEG